MASGVVWFAGILQAQVVASGSKLGVAAAARSSSCDGHSPGSRVDVAAADSPAQKAVAATEVLGLTELLGFINRACGPG